MGKETKNKKEEEKEEQIADILTPKQEKFCRNYTQNYEFFGNATLSYADAYGYDLDSYSKDDAIYERDENGKVDKSRIIEESTYSRMYNLCSSYGSRLRRNDKIQQKCREYLNEFLKDEVIDARLIEIILNGNDGDSLNAIKEYNKLKQRITDKSEIKHTGVVTGFEFVRNDGDNQTKN